MIVRIIGKGQFEVNSSLFDELNRIDDTIIQYVQKGDEERFKSGFSELINLVLSTGKQIPDDQLCNSTIIVPPVDLTLEEAKKFFTGSGIM